MKIKYLLACIVLMLLTGCASMGDNQRRQGEVARITPEELAKILPPPIATYTLEEVVADSKQGKAPDVIIAKIKETKSRYELTTTQVLDLNKQGVNTAVLDYIQQSNELAKQNAIAEEMNRREQENQQQLAHERLARQRYYDPFWGPRYNFYYGSRYGRRFLRGPRFGWGLSFGRPFGHPFGW